MSLCPSGLLMSALSLTIVLFDLYHHRMDYVFIHSILGLIICILFFTMCNYGLEMVNWILLGFIPGYILLSWLFSKRDSYEEDQCDSCKAPLDSCKAPLDSCKAPSDSCKAPLDSCKAPSDSCKAPLDSYKHHERPSNSCKSSSSYKSSGSYKNTELSCPAKPISLGTECGISRFT